MAAIIRDCHSDEMHYALYRLEPLFTCTIAPISKLKSFAYHNLAQITWFRVIRLK